MKMTGGYTGDQKPVREGIYQREWYLPSLQYAYWTGRYWMCGDGNVELAMKMRYGSARQNLPWRGVAK